MSSNTPKITLLCQGIESHLETESNAGRIEPAILSLPKFLDLDTHDQYPAVAVRHLREHPAHRDRGNVTYETDIHVVLWLLEPRDAMAPSAIALFTRQVFEALNRETENYGIGAHLLHTDTRYTLYDGRDESNILRGARLEFIAQYKEAI